MTKPIEVTNKTLESFLDAIGFSNYCCNCPNDKYTIEKPFTAQLTDKQEGE